MDRTMVSVETRECSGCGRVYASITRRAQEPAEITRYPGDAPISLIQHWDVLYVECLTCGALTRADPDEWFRTVPSIGEPSGITDGFRERISLRGLQTAGTIEAN